VFTVAGGYINRGAFEKFLRLTHEASVMDREVFMYPAHPAIDQTTYIDARKKYHKNACKNLPEDEHLDVRNMSKTV
jgi:hypothetical protein